jgi:hypothetical protein
MGNSSQHVAPLREQQERGYMLIQTQQSPFSGTHVFNLNQEPIEGTVHLNAFQEIHDLSHLEIEICGVEKLEWMTKESRTIEKSDKTTETEHYDQWHEETHVNIQNTYIVHSFGGGGAGIVQQGMHMFSFKISQTSQMLPSSFLFSQAYLISSIGYTLKVRLIANVNGN